MNLVLFEDALMHLMRINRTIQQKRGSAMLVGVGGSGKQSLTRLAAFISGHHIFQITITKTYGEVQFLEDLKELLLQKTGMVFVCSLLIIIVTFLYSRVYTYILIMM